MTRLLPSVPTHPTRLMLAPALAACVLLLAAASTAASAAAPDSIPYDKLAARIVTSLKPSPGERVLLRFDPKTLAPLEPVLRKRLEAAGAKVETLNYGPAPDLAARLAQTDVYIWLPVAPESDTPADQRAVLAGWLDEGRGRQIHFHWNGGTRDVDGLQAEHSAAYDRVYVDALNIDYAALAAEQARVIAQLKSGEVHVTSPAGTDLRFRVGDRPFNQQDGDGSKARADKARVRVDREVELPAGVVRVAPIESSVSGVIVISSARFGNVRVTGARLEFENGRVVRATAATEEAALQAFLAAAPGASQFREFGLGFNRKLVVPAGHPYLPYYGYGAGVVRLSLGDSEELGGSVRGGGVRWMFFPDTTVTVNGQTLVRAGRLAGK